MQRPKPALFLLAAFALLLAACSDEPGERGGPLDPPLDPPIDPPGEEIPPECARAASIGFDAELAALLSDFAEQAYEIDGGVQPGDVVGTRSECWELVEFLEHVDSAEWIDTQLYVARNRFTDDIVVAFRGSQEDTDTWTDIDALGGDWTLEDGRVIADSVHRGFARAYAAVRSSLRDRLRQLVRASDDAALRVHLTGHSLGGALATLAALDLAPMLRDEGVAASNVILYSFGAPRSLGEVLLPHFSARVPQAFAVAILRDWVTHVPVSPLEGPNEWTHIPQMVLLHGDGARTRADFGAGDAYGGCLGVPIPLSFAHHGIALYQSRIEKLGAPVSPVSLSVSADGNLVLHWSAEAVGPCDWVGLYRGYPSDADDHLGLFSWDWAEGATSYKTWWAKGDDYYGAYVNGFGEILARSQPYVPSTPTVWISRYDGVLTDWVQLNWSVSDPGENDFVALYASHPPTAGTNGYMTWQWQWALEGNSYATNTVWGSGYYIAYVMEDDDGRRRILAWAGPN